MYAILLLWMLAAPLLCASGQQDPLREAQRLRDNGQLVQALALLDQRLAQNPADVEAARMRAQTLYWLKDFAQARSSYAAALQQHPRHEPLRVEYARMLAETGDRPAAKAILDHLRGDPLSPDAAALLGTILYWDGDLTGARRLFLDAVDTDPTQREAARQLREIQVMSSSWVRVAPVVWHDDQPLDKMGVEVEAGWFLTPLLSLSVRSEPDRSSAVTAQMFWTNEIEVSHYAPAARLETRLAAGAFRHPAGPGDLDRTWRAALGFRAGSGVTLRGRLAREPYLHTVSSLETPLITRTASGAVHWSRADGWLGEAAVQRQTFPDANAVRTAYAWLLAPLARRPDGQFQAGYAVAASDTDEDRFVLARPQQPFLPDDPRFDFAGVYHPYYTPARNVTHSLIAALTAGSTGPVLRAGGSYGFHAREDATAFQALGTQIVPSIVRRAYTPWILRCSLEFPASANVAFSVGGETGRTAYYQWTTARVQVVYRFLPPDPGDARPR